MSQDLKAALIECRNAATKAGKADKATRLSAPIYTDMQLAFLHTAAQLKIDAKGVDRIIAQARAKTLGHLTAHQCHAIIGRMYGKTPWSLVNILAAVENIGCRQYDIPIHEAGGHYDTPE